MTSVEVREDQDRGRFVGYVDDQPAGYIQYHRFDDSIALMHTEVSDDFAGKGVGSALARAVLDRLREEGVPVRPHCPYVVSWIDRHPEYRELVAVD